MVETLPLRERNKQKVTERIIAAAVELFKARGYNQVTMDDIAEQAEISRGTLFNYFPTKEALLLPWGQQILDGQIRPGLQAHLAKRPTTAQALQALFTNISENVLASPDVIQAFVREAMKRSRAAQPDSVSTGFQETFVQVLEYGRARGEVRDDIPLENLVRYLMAVHASLLFCLLESMPPEDSACEISLLLAFIETGLSPQPVARVAKGTPK